MIALGGAASAGADTSVTCASVAPLTAAAKQTLARDDRAVEQIVSHEQGGTTTSWIDHANGRTRTVFRGPRGKIHDELVTIGRRFVDVDYEARTWTSSVTPPGLPAMRDSQTATETSRIYRDQLANREGTIVGNTIIDGVPTVHVLRRQTVPPPSAAQLEQENKQLLKRILKQLPKRFRPLAKGFHVPIPKSSFPTQHIRTDTWLDESTYLPVRIRTVTGGGFVSDESDTWLRRTVQNLASTHVVIPSGFRHYRQNGSGFAESFSSTFSGKPTPCHAP
jgi:hypothetical protein